ncbi:zinc finger CCCH domain-containing protein 25 [Dendrobium catenatum]|uniref:Zinc finger CCCH domain-containing protein 42 n=1 Tax=Dendrobium catenatum TaxID=906689 RepID=A0A2I0WKU3_9ASPA|nr:zinc finger CCCH domain-containing protein 25 [Dendrobium catenatum]XP_020678859.1 zinc finger CCCH domain-containing protein 25 [Dendrobium catenatum]XP_020678860.1 zinc finger CCCH domain-containing protein 25 [Dendrobium catenatum]PKU76281.1 Zinc finger CCCH domain-containing protein 42 [Dendrobium catenatum]
MNPLTLVKRIQKINSTEATLGISEDASWHAKYKDSAYVFVGGIPYDLTEGDLLAIFAQYGEVVDVNLVRDKASGKSKGFAFLAYEDQRSTILAVDNLNGAKVLGRIIRVDHVNSYKRKEEEDEETEREKRDAHGICRSFQRGECNRGSSCKFSHDEQLCANTGWGAKGSDRWGHDKYAAPPKSHLNSTNDKFKVDEYKLRSRGKDGRHFDAGHKMI